MTQLNHKGPEDLGQKTGRKLGKCKKTEYEKTGKYGKGEGLRRHSGGGTGKGKRLKYNQDIL